MGYIKAIKAALFVAALYLSYDYGVTTTQNDYHQQNNELWDLVEVKQDEAYLLAVKLAESTQKANQEFKIIEKKVIEYVEKDDGDRCIDREWVRLKSDAVRAHNRAIGIQQPATSTDGAAGAAASAGVVLANDVSNIETCAKNAKKLKDLQDWVGSQGSERIKKARQE